MASQALKSKSDIQVARKEMTRHGQIYADMFSIGLLSGLRQCDVRDLQFKQINWQQRTIEIIESKQTKAAYTKLRKPFVTKVREALSHCGSLSRALKADPSLLGDLRNEYIEHMSAAKVKKRIIQLDDTCFKILQRRFAKWGALTDYVFTSRDTGSNNKRVDQPISRSAQSQVFAKVKAVLNSKRISKGLRAIAFSCHSVRKTAGYTLYNATKDIMAVCQFLNHSDPSVTRVYIGLDDDQLEQSFSILSRAFAQ